MGLELKNILNGSYLATAPSAEVIHFGGDGWFTGRGRRSAIR